MKSLRDHVCHVLRQKHDKIRSRFEAEHKKLTYRPGDRVWVRVLPKDHQKLDPLWMSPCEILNHFQFGVYEVRTPKETERLHMASLKPCHEPFNGEAVPFQILQTV